MALADMSLGKKTQLTSGNKEDTLKDSFDKLLSVEDQLHTLLGISNDLRRNMEGTPISHADCKEEQPNIPEECSVVKKFDFLSSRLSSLIHEISINNERVLTIIG